MQKVPFAKSAIFCYRKSLALFKKNLCKYCTVQQVCISLSSLNKNTLVAENHFVPDCSGVVTVHAFVTVNLLIEHFEMPVYYYY